MNLTVLSATFYKNESLFAPMKDSCERMGLPLVMYGLGEGFPGFYEGKVVRLLEALRGVDTEYVLFCDARDTVILRDEKAIVDAYKSAAKSTGSKIVFCADRKCFPYPELSGVFEKIGEGHTASTCLWKGANVRRVFLNAGVFMSTRKYLVKCLNRLMSMYAPEQTDFPEDDQGWWCRAVAQGLVDISIDYKCELVAMTTYTPDSWYSLSNGKCAFTPTKTKPCVLHFAGRKDTKRRMPVFLERMGL